MVIIIAVTKVTYFSLTPKTTTTKSNMFDVMAQNTRDPGSCSFMAHDFRSQGHLVVPETGGAPTIVFSSQTTERQKG